MSPSPSPSPGKLFRRRHSCVNTLSSNHRIVRLLWRQLDDEFTSNHPCNVIGRPGGAHARLRRVKRSGTGVLVCMFFLVECGMDGRWSRKCGGGGGGGVPSRISRSAMSYPTSSLLEWCICTDIDSYETRALSGRPDAG